MDHFFLSLVITYLLSLLLAAAAIRYLLNRWRRLELLKEKRARARAAEECEFDLQMRRKIERERIMREPVTAAASFEKKYIKKAVIRKATGFFSDEAAQKAVNQ